MVITFSSSRKGLGKTVTLINTAMFLSEITKASILIIDKNRQNHIQRYLKGKRSIKTLDDYITLFNLDKIDNFSLKRCTSNVSKNIDIIGANSLLELEQETLSTLLEQAENEYKYILIDIENINNPLSEYLLKESDLNIVLLNQSVELIESTTVKNENKNKTIYVVNKYLEAVGNKKISYTKYKIENQLIKQLPCSLDELNTSIDKEYVYKLPLDAELINFHNENTLASYALTSNGKYKHDLELIIKKILFINGELEKYYQVSNETEAKKGRILKFISSYL